MKPAALAALVLTFTLPIGACVQEDDTEFDQQRLAEYRAALPSKAALRAEAPQPTSAKMLGDPAIYPHSSWPIVEGINGAVENMIDVLDTVVSLPPTFYNSETLEFVWGPYPNDDGVGYIAAYIKDTQTDEDFRYQYAFLRGASNDLATLTPIIWGGATPDPTNDDHGVGVTLWDFEANRAFEEANDPAYDENAGNRGRFAALYAAGNDEDEPANEVAYVVSVFRNFVPEDNPTADPTDLDYFYGHYVAPEHTLDFLDYEAAFDVSDPADGIAEDVGVRLAFLDEGTGRAEADAMNGSLAANQSVEAVECWDTAIDQTYLSFELLESGDVLDSYVDGELTNCGLFQATLDDLQIPSLQDIDPTLLAALDDAAENGVPSE